MRMAFLICFHRTHGAFFWFCFFFFSFAVFLPKHSICSWFRFCYSLLGWFFRSLDSNSPNEDNLSRFRLKYSECSSYLSSYAYLLFWFRIVAHICTLIVHSAKRTGGREWMFAVRESFSKWFVFLVFPCMFFLICHDENRAKSKFSMEMKCHGSCNWCLCALHFAGE